MFLVDRLAASRNGTCRFAARVKRVLTLVVFSLVGGGEDAWADIGPGAVVERLLLTPQDVRIWVLVEVGSELR